MYIIIQVEITPEQKRELNKLMETDEYQYPSIDDYLDNHMSEKVFDLLSIIEQEKDRSREPDEQIRQLKSLRRLLSDESQIKQVDEAIKSRREELEDRCC